MNARKFFGANSSEALREVKRALGADAVVLANRRVGGQVEITALAPEALARLTSGASSSAAPPEAAPAALRKNPRGGTPPERPAPPPSAACSEPSVAHLMSELKALRGTMESQLAGIAWSDLQRREPLRARLLREMLGSGFTPALARLLADGSPAGRDYEDTIQWAQAVLARNLLVADDDEIVARGGVYALVGPTGVGKTTTTAKLAARCVVRHGAERLALLTTDGYRVGAHEQLRIYGKILGVAVHAVRDAEDLRVRLAELGGKHLVLIDTMGMGQRATGGRGACLPRRRHSWRDPDQGRRGGQHCRRARRRAALQADIALCGERPARAGRSASGALRISGAPRAAATAGRYRRRPDRRRSAVHARPPGRRSGAANGDDICITRAAIRRQACGGCAVACRGR